MIKLPRQLSGSTRFTNHKLILQGITNFNNVLFPKVQIILNENRTSLEILVNETEEVDLAMLISGEHDSEIIHYLRWTNFPLEYLFTGNLSKWRVTNDQWIYDLICFFR